MRQTRRTAEGVKAHGGDKAMCFFVISAECRLMKEQKNSKSAFGNLQTLSYNYSQAGREKRK